MAKGVFLSLPLHGHTNPTLPLIAELVAGGDEILYYSEDPFAAKIERTGSAYRRYRNAFLADMKQLPERMDALVWLLARTMAEVLEEELDTLRAERPDYLLTDSVAPWGQWAGQILGVPVVTSVSTFAFNRRVLAYGVARGVRPTSARVLFSKMRHLGKAVLLQRRLRRRYGVQGPGTMGILIGRSGLNIVYTSRHFQPCAETFDERFAFIGPSMAPRADSDDFPWEQLRHPVVVYVSMGTLFNTDAAFYRACFDAFGDQDLQVVMSIGARVARESLGPVPANVIVQSHVPQLEVLRRASVFVTHGGMNSVSESLHSSVPVVVIPHAGEQAIVGRRVEELGAGVYLAKEDVTADSLRQSVARLLADRRFVEHAAAVRDSFDRSGGVARAAAAIRGYTPQGRSRPVEAR